MCNNFGFNCGINNCSGHFSHSCAGPQPQWLSIYKRHELLSLSQCHEQDIRGEKGEKNPLPFSHRLQTNFWLGIQTWVAGPRWPQTGTLKILIVFDALLKTIQSCPMQAWHFFCQKKPKQKKYSCELLLSSSLNCICPAKTFRLARGCNFDLARPHSSSTV